MTEHLALPLYIKAIKANVEEVAAKTEAIGYAVCDRKGNFLTDNLPESVCKDMIQICNTHHYNSRKTKEEQPKIIFHAVIPLEPVALPQDRIILKNRQGRPVATMPRYYQKYLNDFYKYTFENELFLSQKIPIDEKCQVTGLFYVNTQENIPVSSYVESLLDCLTHSGIIKSSGRYLVTNTDGSRVFTDEANPRTEIFIRKFGE